MKSVAVGDITGFRGGVDKAERTGGDDLAADLASAALEMSLSAGRSGRRADRKPPACGVHMTSQSVRRWSEGFEPP
jgi:hypothetical protein